jgi:hypothetical protein
VLRLLRRVLVGAGLGLGFALAFLVCLIVVVEYAYSKWGFRYDDMDLAYLSWGLLMAAPIVGGWFAWVRR